MTDSSRMRKSNESGQATALQISEAIAQAVALLGITDGQIGSAIEHGHTQTTYGVWINSLYCGYKGWYGNTTITTLTLNSSIHSIGSSCFSECTALKEIHLPQSLKAIGDSAFYDLEAIQSMSGFPSKIESIGEYAFYNCKNLSCELSSEIRYVGKYCFYGCENIAGSIKIGEDQEEIYEHTFDNCSSISKLEISDTVEKIGEPG